MVSRDIPFVDPTLDEQEVQAVNDVVKSKMLIENVQTRKFEQRFAKFTNTKYAHACVNGTAALHLAMETLDLAPGDEVITTPFTFIATSNSILFSGLIPKFVDVESNTWNLDPDKVEKAITKKTKAIMPVHIFGLPVNMKHINEIAENYDLKVIEDAAQGFGAKIDGKHVGGFGDVATFSLYATKNLITGEGGVVTTDDENLSDIIESLKNHGRTKEGGYKHVRVGFNYRMTDMQGAIGRVQMEKADKILASRSKNANHYREVIDNIKGIDYQQIPSGFTHGNYIFAIDTRKSETKPKEAIEKFKQLGVLARPIYSTLSYQQENFKNINTWRWAKVVNYPDYNLDHCPIAEDIAMNHFEIPVVPSLTNAEREKVGEAIKVVFA
jgi:perosamine synthetase